MVITKLIITFSKTNREIMITYKGIDYPTRDLTIIAEGDEIEVTISVQALADAIADEVDVDGSYAQQIDESIYFYVEDELFGLDDATIAREHLDEPFELAEED